MPKYKTAKTDQIITSFRLGELIEKIKDDWVKSLTVFLWAYGIRISEALALTYDDFYINSNRLYVSTAANKNRAHPIRDLTLPLDSPCFDVLVQYLKQGWDLSPNGLVWEYSDDWYRKQLKKIDPSLSPHVFRHNRVNRSIEFKDNEGRRPDDWELAAWFGHSDTRTIAKYQHNQGILAQELGEKMKIK